MADVRDGDISRVKTADAGIRLDRWLKTNYPALPHGLMQKLLRTGQVRVNGARAKTNTRLAPGQRVRVPPLKSKTEPASIPHGEREARGCDAETVSLNTPWRGRRGCADRRRRRGLTA